MLSAGHNWALNVLGDRQKEGEVIFKLRRNQIYWLFCPYVYKKEKKRYKTLSTVCECKLLYPWVMYKTYPSRREIQV